MERKPISKSERRLLAVCVLAVALLATGAWVGGLHRIPADTSPPQQLPVPNAYDTWTAAGRVYVPSPVSGIDEINDPVRTFELQMGVHAAIKTYSPARREAWLKRNAGALALVRRGLGQQYFTPRSDRYGLGSQLRDLGRLLAVESHARALRGDWPGAADSALDCIEMGTKSARGGGHLGYLVSGAISTIGQDELWKTLPHLDAAITTRVLNRLINTDSMATPFSQVLRKEKDDTLREYIDDMKNGDFPPDFLSDDHSTAAKTRWKIANYVCIINDHAAYWDKFIALADRPVGAITFPPVPGCSLSDPFICHTHMAMFRWMAFVVVARYTASRKLLILLLALRQYHFLHGRYPDWLNALDPPAFKATSVDPFGTGAPFLYRRTGTSYLLYSVGPNGVDDHGQIDPMTVRDRLDHEPRNWFRDINRGGDMVAFAN